MTMSNHTIILATANAGKRREFESLIADLLEPGWKLVDRLAWPCALAEPVEDADSFEGNAIIKAAQIARATGCCALSDDSGLEVDALGARPGIHSARYAGPAASDADNNRLLIEELAGVDASARGARYVAVVCLAIADNAVGRQLLARCGLDFDAVPAGQADAEGKIVRHEELAIVWFQGTVEGRIIDAPRGTGGFGYDPHFLVPSWNQTMAEVPLELKNTVSHRAVALAKLTHYFDPRATR
ncbi:MAG: non-canonical purine NTP pyrophosphatase [Bradymonadaceae bacterium]|nr:non-canonical purine NTP pyrophosphatase [Lujinxingiaceae bacterium]